LQSNAATTDSKSPDIEILEAQKEIILQELDGGPRSPPLDRIASSSPVPGTPCTPEPSLGRSMSLAMGTPLIKSASPFEKLPSAHSFSEVMVLSFIDV